MKLSTYRKIVEWRYCPKWVKRLIANKMKRDLELFEKLAKWDEKGGK